MFNYVTPKVTNRTLVLFRNSQRDEEIHCVPAAEGKCFENTGMCSSRDIRPSMSNQLYVGMDGFLEELEPVFQVFLRQELSLPLRVKHENR